MATSYFAGLNPANWFQTPQVVRVPKNNSPDNANSSGFFSSLSSWWSKPWGSSVGEGLNNVLSGITQPLIPVLVLVIIGGVIALKIVNKVSK